MLIRRGCRFGVGGVVPFFLKFFSGPWFGHPSCLSPCGYFAQFLTIVGFLMGFSPFRYADGNPLFPSLQSAGLLVYLFLCCSWFRFFSVLLWRLDFRFYLFLFLFLSPLGHCLSTRWIRGFSIAFSWLFWATSAPPPPHFFLLFDFGRVTVFSLPGVSNFA